MLVPGRLPTLLLCVAWVFLGCAGRSPEAVSSQQRLVAHVAALAVEIGPRPTASQKEAQARKYILRHLSDAGLKSYEMPVGEVRTGETTDILLDSANVIGIQEGHRSGAILLGAHHDSRSADCPGASDDASGVAVLLEAARRLASVPHQHTFVFASFTGEETWGLPGSRQFLKDWHGPPILAAITLDFVGSGKLFVAPFPVPPERWANRLLARAEARARTGNVLFDPWLVIVPRVLPLPYGADHESFLDAGIPALNLSCQFPAWTYHLAEDRASRVERKTLLSAVDLVSNMMQLLDEDPRAVRGDERDYVPFSVGGTTLFAPVAWAGIVLALVVVLAGWKVFVNRRDFMTWRAWLEALRIALVAIPFTALAVSGGFVIELLVRRMGRVQIGWLAHPSAHTLGALVALAATIWISTGLFRFVRPSIRPGPYLALAIVFQCLEGIALAAAGRQDIALYLWLGAAGLCAASYSWSTLRRLGWGILGFAAGAPLLSPEAYRMFVELSGASLPSFLIEGTVFLLALPWFLFVQHLACLPQVLLDRSPTRLWGWTSASALACATLGMALLNAWRPSYDAEHRAVVQVFETLDLSRRTVEARFASQESLGQIRARGLEASLPDKLQASLPIAWSDIRPPELAVEVKQEGEDQVVRMTGSVPGCPRLARLRIRSRDSFQVLREGNWEATREYERITLPVTGQVLDEVRIRPAEGAPVELEAEVRSDQDLLGVHPTGENRIFRFASRILLSGRVP